MGCLKIQNTHNPDSQVFEVERSAAEHSAVIGMLLKDFEKLDLSETTIPISIEVSDACLTYVFLWAAHWKDVPKPSDVGEEGNGVADIVFTAWDKDFFCAVGSEMMYEVLITSNYLEIKRLYHMACLVVVDMILGKTTEEMRKLLNVENDFTAEEEEAIRRESMWAYEREEGGGEVEMTEE